MIDRIKGQCQNMLNRLGYEAVGFRPGTPPEDLEILRQVAPYTMTGPLRILAAISASEYLARNQVAGALVECGVWKGGSIMAMLYKLIALGDTSRDVYLYDTFEGMTKPSTRDVSFRGEQAADVMAAVAPGDEVGRSYAPYEAVYHNVARTGYPMERVHFIKGTVEETLPAQAAKQIALLRLDTNWYESTKHELTCLYPNLVRGGVLILDDYGQWEGFKRATDEYFQEIRSFPLLTRLDYTGRIALKP